VVFDSIYACMSRQYTSFDYADSLQTTKLAYRSVFDVPVFLCVFHVLQAWLLQVRNKLRDKGRFKEAFDALYNILYLRATGTFLERSAAVDQSIADFKQAFATEMSLVQYFEVHWQKKKGMQQMHAASGSQR
jgi:hypothetical protein